ncbi:SusC/RagA family TonB-linked outer membrane protein [Leeuwenhoekiella sp. W20_SRS_FM14]|uniref:SusC/RagA family TonB-linked outer membrane protein n=1 Tax=Leeuwenhoekiella sp. W20_SRS_FM14 TaxID=3240270 RepID=UPI003F973BB7
MNNKKTIACSGDHWMGLKVKSAVLVVSCFSGLLMQAGINNSLISKCESILKNESIRNENYFPVYLIKEQQKITGTVTDRDGNPVIGVNVMVKGTTTGTVTDFDGNFSIEAKPDQILVFSFVGFKSQEMAIANNSNIEVMLEDDVSQLDDVVLIGYTERKESNITSAVATIKSDEISRAPVTNLSQALAGRLPGVVSTQRGGEPGYDGAGVSIRGFGNALVIVDGVPQNYTQLDPNEVASITILKDAAAAVYGVRAANGVILVETKKGKYGKPVFKYDAYVGVQTPTRYPKLTNAADFVLLNDEGEINQGRPPVYGKEVYEQYKNGELPSYDWYDLTIRQYSPQTQHTISAQGGTEDIDYYMSVGMFNQEGMWRSKDTDYERYNFRSKVTSRFSDNFSATMNLSGRIENRNTPGLSAANIMWGILRAHPTSGPYANDNPEYYNETNVPFFQPVALSNSAVSGYNRDNFNNFTGILSLDYKVKQIEGLSLKGMYSYLREFARVKTWRPEFDLYNYNAETETYNVGYTGGSPTRLTETFRQNTEKLAQFSMNYKRTFGDKHTFEGLALFEQRESYGDDFNASREYSLDAVQYLFAGLDANKNNNGGAYEYASRGLVGRAYYDYDDKYILELVFRYDGSSRFPQGSQWGFFPAITTGWRISDEGFFKNNIDFVNNLKLRGSWGKVGDDQGANYQFVTGFTYPSGNYIYGNNVVPGLVERGIPNPNLTWYESTTTNLGLDAAFLNSKLTVQFDYFYRERDGLLATRFLSLPGTFGASLPQENLNSDSDRGFELVLGTNQSLGDFKFDVTANVTYTRSKYGYQERAPFTSSENEWRQKVEGRWKNIWWGYEAIGQFQSQEEIDNWPVVQDGQGNRSLRPGDIKYLDYNGDGIIDGGDNKPIGRGSTPEIMFGSNINVTYKNFDFSVLFQGAANFNFYFTDEFQSPIFNNANSLATFMDRWRREDPYDATSEWIPGKYPATIPSGSPNNKYNSSFWLQNASYLRLKNIQLGFTLPKGVCETLGITNARVYINGLNIYTWDKLKYANVDPETPGGNGLFYPQQRVWNTGVNISF